MQTKGLFRLTFLDSIVNSSVVFWPVERQHIVEGKTQFKKSLLLISAVINERQTGEGDIPVPSKGSHPLSISPHFLKFCYPEIHHKKENTSSVDGILQAEDSGTCLQSKLLKKREQENDKMSHRQISETLSKIKIQKKGWRDN